MNNIVETIISHWKQGRQIRIASKGWLTGNAPCCVYNGETADHRGRGGILKTPTGGVRYHCFNCGYTAGWEPGNYLSHKLRKLMRWLNIPEEQIQLLVFEAMRNLDEKVVEQERIKKSIDFKKVPLPDSAPMIELYRAGAAKLDPNFKRAFDYLVERGFSLEDYPWQWSPSVEHTLNKRIIIPFYWHNEIIGYTARSSSANSLLKYYNQMDSDYVFNTDAILPEHEFVLVTEGPLDAIAVGGVATLTNEVSETKADIIDSFGKHVIVVPDRDKSGRVMVEHALEYGWSVSFPYWQDDVKDAAKAMERYGRLYTLNSILENVATSKLKIELLAKDIYN